MIKDVKSKCCMNSHDSLYLYLNKKFKLFVFHLQKERFLQNINKLLYNMESDELDDIYSEVKAIG